jgi:hypothetical protein
MMINTANNTPQIHPSLPLPLVKTRTSSWRSASERTYARLMRRPSARMIDLAPVRPGGGCGPRLTSVWSLSRLNGVAVSGKVKLSAIDHGTPSSSMPMLGSPV